VIIDGRDLTKLFREASGGTSVRPMETAEVGYSLELWGPWPRIAESLPRTFDRFVLRGRCAVLTCGCGWFGCGGGLARIEFNDHTVVWGDFEGVGAGSSVRLGPFSFERAQYEEARRTF